MKIQVLQHEGCTEYAEQEDGDDTIRARMVEFYGSDDDGEGDGGGKKKDDRMHVASTELDGSDDERPTSEGSIGLQTIR